MKVLGLTGWSGAGKTTLLTKLIPVLTVRGLTVSTIKHAHHSFDVDKPGKDSHRHRAAGATEVLISSAARWALMHENRDDDEPGLQVHGLRLSGNIEEQDRREGKEDGRRQDDAAPSFRRESS